MKHAAIKHLIVELARAMYRDPTFTPSVHIIEGQKTDISVDLSPHDPGMMIGSRGRMRFALETLANVIFETADAFRITYESSRTREQLKPLDDQPPDMDAMKPLLAAVAELFKCRYSIERSLTMVHSRLWLDREHFDAASGHLNHIFRTVGKAKGFPCTVYLEKTDEKHYCAKA